MSHTLLVDKQLAGHEYGMLRALEKEIVRQTNATVVDLPSYTAMQRRCAHGTRYSSFRSLLPMRRLDFKPSDVLWLVLMGPENYQLDLVNRWEQAACTKVLYLFDTLPHQFALIRKLFANNKWDILVTSFNDAVPHLQKCTGRRWHCVDQGVPTNEFRAPPSSERAIAFSAYGRRVEKVHKATIKFCAEQGLYYDFTTHNRMGANADPDTLYRQYAWHLKHSVFTFSWPVELTNPRRAGGMSPITCRWFEGAAAGTVIIGKAPKNPRFCEIFHSDFVVNLRSDESIADIVRQLSDIWSRRQGLLARADSLRRSAGDSLDWSARVETMRRLLP